jgi:hypothetical protein
MVAKVAQNRASEKSQGVITPGDRVLDPFCPSGHHPMMKRVKRAMFDWKSKLVA